MPRRGYDRRRKCAHEGCREWSITNYEYKRDYVDAVRREKGQPLWKCLRHSEPQEVLSVHNHQVVGQVICEQKEYGQFWEHDGRSGSGFIYGPGFKAWAKDFPPGTRLTITARIDLPDGYTPPPPPIKPPTPPMYHADRVDLDS